MSFRRFEMSEGTSSKFWEIQVEGTDVTTRYGRVGTSGQETVKTEASADAAHALGEKLVREKTRKGYVAVESSGAAPAAAEPKSSEAERERGGAHAWVRKGQRLVYEMADFDAQDAALFTISSTADGLTVASVSSGDRHTLTFTRDALEHAHAFVHFGQGTPYVGDREVGATPITEATPPFLLSRDAFRELKSGATKLTIAPDETATVTKSKETTVRANVAGQRVMLAVLEAQSDDAKLIVLDDAEWPIVFVWRHSGECSTEIRAVGPGLALGEDGELPDVPEFSSYTSADAPAASSGSAATAGPLVALLGGAYDAFTGQETQWGRAYDSSAAYAVVEQASKGALKGDTTVKALATLLKPVKNIAPFNAGPDEFLRACLLAPHETSLPALAQSLIAARSIPTWLPRRPSEEVDRPHDKIFGATFSGEKVYTLGAAAKKYVFAEWNLADGRVTRVVDMGKPGGAATVALRDGTALRIERDKILAAAPGAMKTSPRVKLAEPFSVGLYEIDPTGRFLAEIESDYDDEGLEKPRVHVRSLETGKRVATIELGRAERAYATFAGPESLVVTTKAGVAVYRVGALEPTAKLAWDEDKSGTSISPDGTHVLVGAASTPGLTRLLDTATLGIEREFPGAVRFIDDTLLVRELAGHYEILGRDGATRATFPRGHEVFFGPGANAISFTEQDRKPAIYVWQAVNIAR